MLGATGEAGEWRASSVPRPAGSHTGSGASGREWKRRQGRKWHDMSPFSRNVANKTLRPQTAGQGLAYARRKPLGTRND